VLRYALPALLVAVAALALASRPGVRGATLTQAALLLCAAGCLYLLPLRAFASLGAFWLTMLESAGVLGWLEAQPAYRDGTAPVVTTWRPDGRLAGPRLRHAVRLMPHRATCAMITASVQRAWVIVRRDAALPAWAVPARGEACFAGHRPVYDDLLYAIYTQLPQA
jgi:hypothetical protein